jgi:hypothetical protein
LKSKERKKGGRKIKNLHFLNNSAGNNPEE